MSFFPIKDSSGTTQLVIRKGNADDHLAALSDVPVESTIVIEGQVRIRPEQSRRNVGWWPSLVVLDPHLQHFQARHRTD
jgi:aspartyl-tRNA synthetase